MIDFYLLAGRAGRLRSRPLYRDPGSRRESSGTRERSNSGSRSNSSAPIGNLYVGHDPSTSAGFLSEYTTAPGTRNINRRPKKSQRPEGNSRHRWGHTENPSDDMVLSGNALTGLTINDLLSS